VTDVRPVVHVPQNHGKPTVYGEIWLDERIDYRLKSSNFLRFECVHAYYCKGRFSQLFCPAASDTLGCIICSEKPRYEACKFETF